MKRMKFAICLWDCLHADCLFAHRMLLLYYRWKGHAKNPFNFIAKQHKFCIQKFDTLMECSGRTMHGLQETEAAIIPCDGRGSIIKMWNKARNGFNGIKINACTFQECTRANNRILVSIQCLFRYRYRCIHYSLHCSNTCLLLLLNIGTIFSKNSHLLISVNNGT